MYALVFTILTTTVTPTGFTTSTAPMVRLYSTQAECADIAMGFAAKQVTDLNNKTLYVLNLTGTPASTSHPVTTVLSCVKV